MTAVTPAMCDTRPGSQSCSAWYVMDRAGQRDRSWPWIKAQLEALIACEGFPPPIVLYSCLTPRRAGKPERVDGLTQSSRWNRAAVDAWFDGQPSARIPADLAEAANDTEAARHAASLDARALAISVGAIKAGERA